MNYDTLNYIRTHKNLYRLLRDDSSYYEMIFKDQNSVYNLNKIAKERYCRRYSDIITRISKKIDIFKTILDVFN